MTTRSPPRADVRLIDTRERARSRPSIADCTRRRRSSTRVEHALEADQQQQADALAQLQDQSAAMEAQARARPAAGAGRSRAGGAGCTSRGRPGGTGRRDAGRHVARRAASSARTAAAAPPTAAPAHQPTPTAPAGYTGTPGTHPMHNDPFLTCVRARESGGNYGVVNPAGPYLGAYQFLQATWNGAANHAGRSDLVGVPAEPRDAIRPGRSGVVVVPVAGCRPVGRQLLVKADDRGAGNLLRMTQANPHHITVDDVADIVRVEVDGTVVAESSRARVLREGSHRAALLLPTRRREEGVARRK